MAFTGAKWMRNTLIHPCGCNEEFDCNVLMGYSVVCQQHRESRVCRPELRQGPPMLEVQSDLRRTFFLGLSIGLLAGVIITGLAALALFASA